MSLKPTTLRPYAGREIAPFTTADLIIDAGREPTVLDVTLADRLGFQQPRQIRELIKRNREELEAFGSLSYSTTNSGTSGGRPAREVYLNRQQAMLLTILSKTSIAAKVRKQMIEVFDAASSGAERIALGAMPSRDGALPPASTLRTPDDPITRADLAGMLAGIERVLGVLVAQPLALASPAAPLQLGAPQVAPALASADLGAGADLLYGVGAIAAYLGLRERQARTLVDNGTLPTFRLTDKLRDPKKRSRKIVCGRKSHLDAWVAARSGDAVTRVKPSGPPLIDPAEELLADFVDAAVVKSPESKVAARRFYEAYLPFAARRGLRPVSEVLFARSMERRVGGSARAVIDGRNCQAYYGIRLQQVEALS